MKPRLPITPKEWLKMQRTPQERMKMQRKAMLEKRTLPYQPYKPEREMIIRVILYER